MRVNRVCEGKSREEIASEVVKAFSQPLIAVQIGLDTIRVTFRDVESFRTAHAKTHVPINFLVLTVWFRGEVLHSPWSTSLTIQPSFRTTQLNRSSPVWLSHRLLDIVCLQETHAVSASESSAWFSPYGFLTVSAVRSARARGVAILYHPRLILN